MRFRHSDEIWQAFPELVPGVLHVDGITPAVAVGPRLAPFHRTAAERLATASEGEFPEIRAWRRAFARMGLKPTQYRCAAESLLRRFRKEGALPPIHPLVDLCNAVSLAFAIPVAALDVARITGNLDVRHATGAERYATFSGETEHPDAREVIFADEAGRAHARRWTNRQSGDSAVRETTGAVLIVAEAMHESAAEDIERLLAALAAELAAVWPVTPRTAILNRETPRFEV